MCIGLELTHNSSSDIRTVENVNIYKFTDEEQHGVVMLTVTGTMINGEFNPALTYSWRITLVSDKAIEQDPDELRWNPLKIAVLNRSGYGIFAREIEAYEERRKKWGL